ncbi:MAG: hypothetical protein U0232_08780 [Thermomicrobiales bacterium]
MAESEAIARILARIERDRPAAIAGPAEFWARITALSRWPRSRRRSKRWPTRAWCVASRSAISAFMWPIRRTRGAGAVSAPRRCRRAR